jgi:hydroxymethylbilane synthase
MPTELPDGLTLAAVPEREDAHDALVGRRLSELSDGARVGTSSLRRAAQLRAHRAGLEVESLRGNLDTRLRKLDEGRYDAIVLAAAGLNRLGWTSRITELLPFEVMCPAVGQGALALETRRDGGPGVRACRTLDHPASRLAVTAERAFLNALGGGCQVPIGAHATASNGTLHLRAVVISPDGTRLVRRETSGGVVDPESLGATLGREVLSAGAREILAEVYGPAR